jgi:hypothetical protein
MVKTYPHAIRKRPRRTHKFTPILAIRAMQDYCHGDHICDDCMAGYAADAEHNRPGHAWTVENGKVVFLEDKIAESMLGRPLLPTEMVVHKNGDPLLNTHENLEIITMPKAE